MADDFNFSLLHRKGCIKTYPPPKNKAFNKFDMQKVKEEIQGKIQGEIQEEVQELQEEIQEEYSEFEEKRKPLTTKNAVRLLLHGALKSDVCRYCLNVTKPLSELDQIMQVATKGTLFKVTIRDMVASFYPIQVRDDRNFPNKICDECLDSTIKAYLFTQQCEQAERALHNCFDDIYEKVEKLDPIEIIKKRGRRKVNPNHNIIYAEHENVINYAQPIINLVNTSSETLTPENAVTELECLKCSQVLPNIESLLNHEKGHPTTMWYNCRMCGKAFLKRHQIKKHFQSHLSDKPKTTTDNSFVCKECDSVYEKHTEYLQHIEKHKFKIVMEHLLERKMDKLCSICLTKGRGMVDMEKMICLHGGNPNLSGDQSLYSILASTLPDMNNLDNYTGTKICEKCLNQAINAYVFTNQFLFNKARLDTCVTLMLQNLNELKNPENNIFVEISQNTVLPIQDEIDDIYICDKDEIIDETKIKIDVLEDEFRTEIDNLDMKENSATETIKTHTKYNLLNGIQTHSNSLNVCSEFLAFKSKPKKVARVKYTCSICNKHFITDYHLKNHVIKHINRKVTCKLCLKQFESKFHLYEHNKMEHKLKVDYETCNQCGRAFNKRKKLKKHLKSHLKILCELCNKVFGSQKFYNVHMQRHKYKLNRYKQKHVLNCSFCEKEFVGNNELYCHINKEHIQIKPYDCDMCEKQFYTAKDLRYHKKIHGLFSKEICVFCNKELKCRRQLVYHVWEHLGVTPFSCQVCRQAFHTKSKLRLHMKVYHGGNFCCAFCKKVFLTKFGLKEHVNKAHSFI
ncbi:hypothetical protein K1T71_014005 [Dendrolimus kikuchii]|uniref:Uncharacterized protein n=1 Tax=Dendrolimus kikuchii TaxID=765133 RepID=A0ACC1CGQ7_9NEOP|nr:hypothetical protein K1T71_014005 [Dendrolimus kikuchii]